jgi:predicted CopG family antitoxin
MIMAKRAQPKFERYPSRHLTISDEVWELLKKDKGKSGKTWTNYLKDLLSGKNK